jgi:2-amino-4-hydroxy-6-hydroxymethyldihydropteridine diphosphokinase
MSPTWTACYIGIGSNLGDARDNVERAMQRLADVRDTRFVGQSSLFRTAPLEANGDDYVNAVARIDTRLTALQLLQTLQAIEQDFGRERPYPNAPRTLDLDLLLYGSQTISTDTLTVPHPRLTQRAFVLIPLLQLDPLIMIPGRGPAHEFVPAVAGQSIRKI